MAASFTCLNIHLVFSTKERRPILKPNLRTPLFPYVAGIVKNLKGHLIEAGGVDDHVHLLLRLHQDVSVSESVRTIKSNSSKWLRESHDSRWLGWQDGYGAFSVSSSGLPDVQNYIRRQEEHPARMTFSDEFRTLLQRHGIDFNDRAMRD